MKLDEYKAKFSRLPGWRRPAFLPDRDPRTARIVEKFEAEERALSELNRISEAAFDSLGGSALSFAEIAERVREDWGDFLDFLDLQLTAALRMLLDDRAIVRAGELYVRSE